MISPHHQRRSEPGRLLRPCWLLLVVCLVGVRGASANLGQTHQEAIGRYGEGKAARAMKPAEDAQTFSFDGLMILVEYWKERSSSEQYQKTDGSALSEAEINALLASNAEQSSWHPASGDVWVREDKAAVAYLANNRKALVVQTYAYHAEEKKSREQASAADQTKSPPAAAVPHSMTKIVSRQLAPDIPADSFAAKPKTLYLAGNTYARVEEEPDPGQQIHGLMICSEPNLWIINLMDRRGQHVVDPGPTFVVHSPVIQQNAPGELASLELGKELAFFAVHSATRLEPQEVDGQSCEVSEFTQANYRVVLKVRADTHKPFQLDVFRDGQPAFSVRYITYETDLPFDPALFTPPSDVLFTDAKPNP